MMKTWDEAAAAAADKIEMLLDDWFSTVETSDTRSLINRLKKEAFPEQVVINELLVNRLSWLGASALKGLCGDQFDVAPEVERITALVISKQHDYGTGNILAFGVPGLVVRVHDKVARWEHLTALDAEAKNESLDDTLADIVGYSIVGIMLLQGQFELPLKETPKACPYCGCFDMKHGVLITNYVSADEPF